MLIIILSLFLCSSSVFSMDSLNKNISSKVPSVNDLSSRIRSLDLDKKNNHNNKENFEKILKRLIVKAYDCYCLPDNAKTTSFLSFRIHNNYHFISVIYPFVNLKLFDSLDLSCVSISDVEKDCYRILKLNELHFKKSSNEDEATKLVILKELNLSYNQIAQIPESFSDLTTLEELNLSYNNLSNIDWAPKLTNLQTLNVSSNAITSVPSQISALSNLSELNLKYNKLTELSDSIIQLTKLRKLGLYENKKLTIAPLQAAQLYQLPLEKLDLEDIQSFIKIPESQEQTISSITKD